MDQLSEEFKCPLCKDYFTIPIKECPHGHSFCKRCIDSLKECPTCLTNCLNSSTRNYTLENMALEMKYPCAYKHFGCKEVLSYSNREHHKLRCKFKRFKCEIAGCNFTGRPSSLKSHWTHEHHKTLLQSNDNFFRIFKGYSQYSELIDAFGKLFWFKLRVVGTFTYFTVQFIGNPEDAKKFYFIIEVISPRNKIDKIRLSANVQELNELFDESFKSNTCVSLCQGDCKRFNFDPDIIQFLLSVFRMEEGEED